MDGTASYLMVQEIILDETALVDTLLMTVDDNNVRNNVNNVKKISLCEVISSGILNHCDGKNKEKEGKHFPYNINSHKSAKAFLHYIQGVR